MDKFIKGKVYVLGDNIDTDQIIPAQYLTYNPAIPEERRMFGRFAMSSVPLPEAGLPKGNVPFIDLTDPDNTKSQYTDRDRRARTSAAARAASTPRWRWPRRASRRSWPSSTPGSSTATPSTAAT